MTDERVDLLDAVRAAHQARDPATLHAELHAAVHAAFDAGAPVRTIAEALGVSQPALTRKFGPFDDTALHRSSPEDEPHLDRVRETARLHVERYETLVAAVAAARQAKVTWQAIADVLGRSQPNVVQEFLPQMKTQTKVKPVPRTRTQTKQVSLTAEQRAALTRRAKDGEPVSALRKEFGVSAGYIRNLRNRA